MASEIGGRDGKGGMVHGVRSLGSATLDLAYCAMGSFDIWWEAVSFLRRNAVHDTTANDYRVAGSGMYALASVFLRKLVGSSPQLIHLGTSSLLPSSLQNLVAGFT